MCLFYSVACLFCISLTLSENEPCPYSTQRLYHRIKTLQGENLTKIYLCSLRMVIAESSLKTKSHEESVLQKLTTVLRFPAKALKKYT